VAEAEAAAATAVVVLKEWVEPQAVMWQLKFQHVPVVYTPFVLLLAAAWDALLAPTAAAAALHM